MATSSSGPGRNAAQPKFVLADLPRNPLIILIFLNVIPGVEPFTARFMALNDAGQERLERSACPENVPNP